MTDVPVGEYGIVANAISDDTRFRIGAKVWLCDGESGDGFEKRIFYGLAMKGARHCTYWARTIRFENYRCAWIPTHMRDRVTEYVGEREAMEEMAARFDIVCDWRRANPPPVPAAAPQQP